MKSLFLPAALLAVLVPSAAVLQARAAPEKEPVKVENPKDENPVALKDLKQPKIRAWATVAVAADRADPKKADFYKDLDALIEIDPEKIVYEHNKGVPTKLLWEANPRRNLTADERLKAKDGLRKVFQFAMFQYNKGLVAGADAKLLNVVTRLDVAPNSGPRKHPDKVVAVPLKELTQETVEDWASAAVDAARKDPAWADYWKEMDELIVIDPEKIIYEQDKGVPVKLAWEVKRKRPLNADERLKAREGLQKLAQRIFFEHEKGIVTGPDVDQLNLVIRTEVEADPETPAPAVVVKSEECDQLRRDLADARLEIDRLRLRLITLEHPDKPQAPDKPEAPDRPQRPSRSERSERSGEPRRYIMVIQPSSMIYYDYCSHCWVPGAASVEYYPVAADDAPRLSRPAPLPTPSLFVAPPPRVGPGLLPPPERAPGGATGAPRPEEADRVFWVGYRSYWQGDYDNALASFNAAIGLDAQDARFWYYRALAERNLGDAVKAEESARRGRELHAAHKPKVDLVSMALERVQGQERRFLNVPEIVVSEAKDAR